MPALNKELSTSGILKLHCPLSSNFINELNSAIDPIFKTRSDQPRSYVTAAEMTELGFFPEILNENMLGLAFGIMPDPVLYHFHAYEIAANQSVSHIFAERLKGFHCDPDSEFDGQEATHVSLFIYLSEVQNQDGPFEFVMQPPRQLLSPSSPVASMLGGIGTTFAWNRSFYHRASPNSGNHRRRLLKLSIQRNRFQSSHLENESFQRVMKLIPPGQDPRFDLLLGRFQGKTAPGLSAATQAVRESVGNVRPLSVGRVELAKENLRQIKRALKPARATSAAYD